MTTLNLHAKQDFLEREAKTSDPIRAISELVWNSLDAEATSVSVVLEKNGLGGLSAITVTDNGHGIKFEQANHDFGNLGDSWKRNAHRTSDLKRAIHGKEGRGRLRFYSLAQRCKWQTTFESDEGLKSFDIEIFANALERCEVSNVKSPSNEHTGTIVRLQNLKDTFDNLDSVDAFREFSSIFAPYILQYTDAELWYNGYKIDPNIIVERWHELPQDDIQLPNRTVSDLRLKVIEWKNSIDARQIHFGGEDGIVLGSQAAHVTAPGFEFSAYAYSSYFQELADKNLLELDDLNDPEFLIVINHIRDELGDYFRQRQSEKSLGVIQELKDAGAYPYEGDPKDEIERRERQVFDIATYAVSSYSKDFTKAEPSLQKMTLTLLKEAIKHNPDELSTILQAVVNLPKKKQTEFSALLKKTELGNIINASSLISERIVVLEILKGIVFNPKYRNTVKERGELDVLIRDHTWLFGEQFHITLSEVGLTRVMGRVSEEVASKRKGRKITKKDGKTGRVDNFLGRLVPNPDPAKREYLLIELKRPSLTVARKELDQVEDYMNAIKDEDDFARTDTTWHFYLISGSHANEIDSRVNQKDRPQGLFLEGENYKVWVKTWSEIIRANEARLKFVQDQLKIEVSDSEIEARIQELQKLVTK
ncbi:ATP-binding protein [Parasphingorhabdus flavimaris]|uniref:ATP-binding protein n=1 Tax=Parasphingorhabdus flavimaris TaxID=266812 RepID=A0ABX2N001_9SPHN|nr:ATP-binding protein [Parasphingorhabdus flavimaris]NVD27018.1 ATP-binding protein [Parasphingorhabdus flavimaris]